MKTNFKLDILFLFDLSADPRFVSSAQSVAVDLVERLQSDDQERIDVRYRVCGFADRVTHPENWWVDDVFIQDAAEVCQKIAALSRVCSGTEKSSLLEALWNVSDIRAKTLKFVDDNKDADITYGPNDWRTAGDWALVRRNYKRVIIFFTPNPARPSRPIAELIEKYEKKYIHLIGVCPLNDIFLELFSYDWANNLGVIDSSECSLVSGMPATDSRNLRPLVDGAVNVLLKISTAHPPGLDEIVI